MSYRGFSLFVCRAAAFAAGGIVAACAGNGTGVPVDEPFDIVPNRAMHVSGTDASITFESVGADSRCPTDVQCVWAGDAAVVLRFRASGRDTTFTLHTGLEPKAGNIGTLRVELVGLAPTPRSTVTTAPGSYRATLIVRSAN